MARLARERVEREDALRDLRLIRIMRGDAESVNQLGRDLIGIVNGGETEVRSQTTGVRQRGRRTAAASKDGED